MRLTLGDIGNTRIPQALGLCADNFPGLASFLNEGTQRLISVGGETGWWGGWDKLGFDVIKADPFITMPGIYARAVSFNLCRHPIRVQNSWYETLDAGIGLQEPHNDPLNGRGGCHTGIMEAYDRGNFITAYDLIPVNQFIRVYITDPRDVGKRILFGGALDQNANGIYTQDVTFPVNGFYLNFESPFTTTTFIVTHFTNVQKDVTYGDVIVNQVDATTGAEVFLARYRPTETNPSYRRYYINRLPVECCGSCDATCGTTPVKTVQVTCMAKLEYRPVRVPSDFLLISNVPALKAECESIRYAEMDTPNAAQLSIMKHKIAIKELQQELKHYEGETQPAVNFAPFGNARLEHAGVGLIM